MTRHRFRSAATRALATLMAMLLVVMGFPAAASAAPDDDFVPGVLLQEPNFDTDGDGRLVVNEGQEYEFTFVYTPGDFDSNRDIYSPLEFKIDLSGLGSVEIPASALVVPADNQNAIERIEPTPDGDGILVYFKDDLSGADEQENFTLAFTIDLDGESTGESTISWSGKADPSRLLIIAEGAAPVVVNPGFDKAINVYPGELPRPDNKDGDLTLGSYITNSARVGYKLVTEVEDGGDITLTDSLDVDWLGFDSSNMNLRISYETWEDVSEGYGVKTRYPANPAEYLPETAYTLTIDPDGTGFTLDVPEVPDNSRLEVLYEAHVTDNQAFIDAIQGAHDAAYGEPGARNYGAEYRVPVENTAEASLGGELIHDDSEVIQYIGRAFDLPGPNPHFSKQVDTSGSGTFGPTRDFSFKDFDADPSRELKTPETVTYRLRADLTAFTASQEQIDDDVADNFILTEDVIITDLLPTGQTWGDITATVNGSPQNLTEYTGSGNPTSRGEYKIDGQNLIINIGRSNADNWVILAEAELSGFAASRARDNETGYYNYYSTNRANFRYETEGNGGNPSDTAEVRAKWRGDTTQGITDSSVFTKTTADFANATPGEPLDIEYTITVRGNSSNDTEIRASETEIIDLVDESVFDLGTNLENVKIEGTYGTANLNQDAFVLARVSDADGQGTPGISIKPAQPFLDAIETLGEKQTLTVKLTLTTFPIEGRQVLEVENQALYRGEKAIEGDYLSSASMKGSSLGNGIQVYKEVYDPTTGEFTDNLRVAHSAGTPTENAFNEGKFTYRIAIVVPHGWNTRMRDIVDALDAAGLDLDGFVTEPTATTTSTSQRDLGRGITASIDGGDIKIHSTLVQGGSGGSSDVYSFLYRAQVRDWENLTDVPVVNKVGKSAVTITKTNEYPLNLQKVNSETIGMDPEDPAFDATITDLDARFEVRDEEGSLLFDDVYVVNGNLVRPLDGEEPSVTQYRAVLVPEPGDYTVKELKAPSGYFLNKTEYAVTVAQNGATTLLEIPNDPMHAGTVSISKTVTGVPASIANGTTFTFDWVADIEDAEDYPAEMQAGTVQVTAGSSAVDLGYAFPPETTVTFTETGTPASQFPGYHFEGVSYPDGHVATVAANDSVTVRSTNTYVPMVSVGDYVWVDTNRNGLQDEPDTAGINGVKLTLSDKDGRPVTDVHGNDVEYVVTSNGPDGKPGWYEFKDLPVLADGEEYVVTIDRDDEGTKEALAPYVPTLSGVGSDRSIDSSTWTATATHEGLTNGGDHNPTLDFGFVTPSFAIGDIVWIDLDRSGAQDNGEQPLAGVTVTLLDENGDPVTEDIAGKPIVPQITGADGLYLFDNLPEGTYRVRFELTADQGKQYQFTDYLRDGVDAADNSDAKVGSNPLVGESGNIVLNRDNAALDQDYDAQEFIATQGVDPTWDAGVFPKAVSVGDLVWVDFNRDGLQDSDEEGIEGIQLILTDKDGDPVTDKFGNPVGPETTDANGRYSFDNLPALKEGEEYRVKIDYSDPDTVAKLAPYVPTKEGANGGSGEFDSSTDEAIATHEGLTEDGQRNPTLDFGFVVKSYAIGDYVWIDTDRNGDQSTGEAPLAGTKVELLVKDGSGNFVPAKDTQNRDVPATTTDEEGRYLFDNLPAGTYKVQFTLTEKQAEIYDFTDSLKSGVDTGLNSDAEPTATKHIGLSGEIVLDENNADLTTSYDRGITATEGIDPTWDAGVVLKRVSVGDYVWVDENRDGIQDDGEPGIDKVKLVITLVDEDGNPVLDDDGKPVVVKDVFGETVAPQVTKDGGKYLFENLPALSTGTQYKVTIDTTDEDTKKALEPYVPTIPGAGDDEGNDSSTSSEVANWKGLQEDGAKNLTLDFGFVTPSFAIGDIVWIDTNRDGIQGADEKPLAGVTVTLLDAATGEPVTVDIAGNDIKPIVTGKDGKYLFDNLPAGTYKVQFELTEEQGKTYKFTSNVPGTNSTDNSDGVVTKNPLVAVTKDIVLDRTNGALDTEYDADFDATEGVDPTWDAGVVLKSVSVGDYVWFDKNGNGKQDKNEKGIGDVKLVLTDKNGKPVKDIFGNEVPAVWTDKNGKYTFENLPVLEPGQEYRVKIDRKDAKTKKALEKYLPTLENQGDPAFDSSTWVAIATSEGLTEDGDRNDTLDFGFILDPKWADTGDDGHEREPNKKPDQSTDGENNEREELEQTGFGGVPVIVFSTLLLALGGAFLAIRRRHRV